MLHREHIIKVSCVAGSAAGQHAHHAAVQHAAHVAALGARGVGAEPLVLEVDHGLLPHPGPGAVRARLYRAVLQQVYTVTVASALYRSVLLYLLGFIVEGVGKYGVLCINVAIPGTW